MPNGEALLRGRLPRQRPRNACQLDNRIGVPSSEGLDGEGEKGDINVGARLKKFGHLSLMGDVESNCMVGGATVHKGNLKRRHHRNVKGRVFSPVPSWNEDVGWPGVGARKKAWKKGETMAS